MAREFARLEPHKNLWGIIKNKLRSKDCTTINKLIEAIISFWYHNDEIAKSCQKLVSSLHKRMKKVLKNKGGHNIVLNVKIALCFEQ